MILSMIWMIFFQIVLPILLFIKLWRGKFLSRISWLLFVIMTGLLETHLFIWGNWSFVSYYLRFVLAVVFIVVALRSYVKVKHLPWQNTRKKWRYRGSLALSSFLSLVFALMVLGDSVGYMYEDKSVHLQFPLKDGVYDVGQGGNSPTINYHNTYPPQAYAMDILKLNRFGTRAAGFMPDHLRKYAIYGDTIYSPCSGKIVEAEDDLQQLNPGKMKEDTLEYRKKHTEGNHVKIRCEGANVHIAHMIPDTVAVKKDQRIKTGDRIGRVGNSGNTSEPHLHIHAERNGEAMPITFEGKFLKRNSLMFSR